MYTSTKKRRGKRLLSSLLAFVLTLSTLAALPAFTASAGGPWFTFTSGADQTWKPGDTDLKYQVTDDLGTCEMSNFQKIEVGGETLSSSDYTITDNNDNTMDITIKASYLAGLSDAKHTLYVYFSTGNTNANFTIETEPTTYTLTVDCLLYKTDVTASKTEGILADDEVTVTVTAQEGKKFKEIPTFDCTGCRFVRQLNDTATDVYTLTVTDFTADTTITVKGTAVGEDPTYTYTEGANGKWTSGADKGLTVRADGDFTKFTGVKVNGTLVDPSNYTAVSGSTIVTLKPEYLKTLKAGTYSLSVVYTDGEAATSFTIQAKDKSPNTGDNSPVAAAVSLAMISLAGFGVLCVSKKKLSK